MNKWFAPLVALIPLVFVGCGGGDQRTPTFAVKGKLTDGSKPVAHAQLVFHPTDAKTDAPKPRGTTDAHGEFTLTTYDGNDGAPAGHYRVTVEQWATTRLSGGPENQLPPKYADPVKSGLTATVNAGPTDLQPFVVKR